MTSTPSSQPKQSDSCDLDTAIHDMDPPPPEQKGLGMIVEEFIINYFLAHAGLDPSSGLYHRVIQEVEKPLIKTTLKSVNGNQKRAAEILGMNRNTLRKKLKELKIDYTSPSSPKKT
jgi:two-component system nitrogen regulation response regulator GlnG